MKCLECGKELHGDQVKFCSHSCAAKFNNTHRQVTTKGKVKFVKCLECGKEIKVSIHAPKYSWLCDECRTALICPFCGKHLKNKNSLSQHIRFCIKNPDHVISLGNNGNMPKHTKSYYEKPMCYYGIKLDITHEQFDKYQEAQRTCEICGRTIDEAVVKQHKYQARHFCLDHDHKTNQFRGLLCSCCNRQLGWYEKYREQISKYLDKDLIEQNKNIK